MSVNLWPNLKRCPECKHLENYWHMMGGCHAPFGKGKGQCPCKQHLSKKQDR